MEATLGRCFEARNAISQRTQLASRYDDDGFVALVLRFGAEH
jgi:hypothetical protein